MIRDAISSHAPFNNCSLKIYAKGIGKLKSFQNNGKKGNKLERIKTNTVLMLFIALTLPACSTPTAKYYSDNAYLMKIRGRSDLSLVDQKKTPLSEMGTYGKPLLTVPSSFIHGEDLTIQNTDSTQTLRLQGLYDYWHSFRASNDPTAKSLGGEDHQNETKPIPLGDAWENAYKKAEEIHKTLSANKTLVANDEGYDLIEFEPNVYIEMTEDVNRSKPPSDVWGYEKDENGNPIPDWYFTNKYSQLNQAREVLSSKKIADKDRVLIAHLDTGFSSKDALLLMNPTETARSTYKLEYRPPYVQDWKYGEFKIEDSQNFFQKKCSENFEVPPLNQEHGECPGHGVKTLSVLSGGEYKFDINGKTYIVGANPYANVVGYRIKDGPIHFRTTEMVEAINSAIQRNVDVISMSAGGFPSGAQRDAVNLAYDKGVAIFAATGDYFKVPFLSIFGFGQTPSMVGYPARYNRVMAVAGTTYGYKSYGDDPYSEWVGIFKNGLNWDKWADWMLRGNYGPKSIMSGGKAVSAYAPNVMSSQPSLANGLYTSVSLAGAGTSHSTPQVAGAASIWLQLQRERIVSLGKWRDSWEKAEAVYQAVSVCSAAKTRPVGMSDSDFVNYFGSGHLKAFDALSYQFPTTPNTLHKRAESRIGHTWMIDLFMTMRKGDVFDPSWERIRSSMMALEAVQFATIDKGLAKAKAALDQCLLAAATKDSDYQCKEKAVDFLDALEAYPELSLTLRKAVAQALSKIDLRIFDNQIRLIRDALDETNPDSCKLNKAGA